MTTVLTLAFEGRRALWSHLQGLEVQDLRSDCFLPGGSGGGCGQAWHESYGDGGGAAEKAELSRC